MKKQITKLKNLNLTFRELEFRLGSDKIDKLLEDNNIDIKPAEINLNNNIKEILFQHKINHGTYRPITAEQIDIDLFRKINTAIYNNTEIPEELLKQIPEETKKSLDAFYDYKNVEFHPLINALLNENLIAFKQLLQAGFTLDYRFQYGARITDYYKGDISKINKILTELNMKTIDNTEDYFSKVRYS